MSLLCCFSNEIIGSGHSACGLLKARERLGRRSPGCGVRGGIAHAPATTPARI